MTATVKSPIYYLVEVYRDPSDGHVTTMSCPTLSAAQRLFSAMLGATLADRETCAPVAGWVNLIGVIDPHDEMVPRVLLQQERWES